MPQGRSPICQHRFMPPMHGDFEDADNGLCIMRDHALVRDVFGEYRSSPTRISITIDGSTNATRKADVRQWPRSSIDPPANRDSVRSENIIAPNVDTTRQPDARKHNVWKA